MACDQAPPPLAIDGKPTRATRRRLDQYLKKLPSGADSSSEVGCSACMALLEELQVRLLHLADHLHREEMRLIIAREGSRGGDAASAHGARGGRQQSVVWARRRC